MMYQEIQPSVLNDSIVSFWFYQGDKQEVFDILPDNCTDLIVNLSTHQLFVIGSMTTFASLQLNGKSDLIGVRFKTEKFAEFSPVPLTEITNKRIEFEEISSFSTNRLLDELSETNNTMTRRTMLERFIYDYYICSYQQKDVLALSIAEQISSLDGELNLLNLSQSNGIGIRQLERRFKQFTGLRLKEFARISQFKKAKKQIETFGDKSLLSIAFDTGYYDHAHMTNSFKKLTGKNPSNFRS